MATPTEQPLARQTLTNAGWQTACCTGTCCLRLHPRAHSAQPKASTAGLAGPWARVLPKEGQAGAHTDLTRGLQRPQADAALRSAPGSRQQAAVHDGPNLGTPEAAQGQLSPQHLNSPLATSDPVLGQCAHVPHCSQKPS